jgi:uncharacterized protein
VPAELAAVGFARALRAAGLDVPVGSVTAFVEALAVVGVGRPERVYWAARSTLVRRPEDTATFDRVFASWWGTGAGPRLEPPVPPQPLTLETDDPLDEEPDSQSPDGLEAPSVQLRYSPAEVLRAKDFAAYSAEEFDEARRLMADLRLGGALRRSRRLRRSPSGRTNGRPDLRRTVRRSMRSGGEPIARAFLEQSSRPRPVVLLCDVSGSMEPYTRALLRFLHAAVAGRSRVEAFALGTRLTRLTRELSSHDPDAALRKASTAVADWSGGTRLGEAIKAFNDGWGVRGMARGAVVVVLSDGWDRGDTTVLASEMQRLRRVAHRVVWVNPLKASPGYTPVAKGMAAALPFVDELVEGHSLASLQALATVVSRP